ncbi:lyase family protein [Microbacterium sp. 1P10UB]|uniref:lyase family protein n=1 Tax=unclassified Microbacterium TaxID=2609290 RepID=UPI0039A1D0D2
MSAIDSGLLSPVTAGRDALVDDAAFLDAAIRAEVALVRAYAAVGVAPASAADDVAGALGVDGDERGAGRPSNRINLDGLAAASVVGGNPIIPLVGLLKERVPAESRAWVHRGATSQDIWDTAIMDVAARAVAQVRTSLTETAEALLVLGESHADDVAAARTLTQHAVPTTIGARVAGWSRAVERAAARLDALEFPAQLGGAGGTRASFVEVTGSIEGAQALAAAYAGVEEAPAPWHVDRAPVTGIGDALVTTLDALGKFAGDVATLSRTEIGEVSEGEGGGSSAMPQKQNPTEAVLIRSAALRAPHLAATLHLASALAVDERPDGAWHAEWPTLRELLRLALGASAHAAHLAAHLRVDAAAARANLASSGGLIVAERLSIALAPLLGKDVVAAIVADVEAGADLADRVRAAVETAGVEVDVDGLVDPANYTGVAGVLVADARAAHDVRAASTAPAPTAPVPNGTTPAGPAPAENRPEGAGR